jgi:hypothetical protein
MLAHNRTRVLRTGAVPKAKPVDLEEITAVNLGRHVSEEPAAWALMERLRWPDGPLCPHCGVMNSATYLEPQSGARTTRAGNVTYRRVWQCRDSACGRQFSVLVGTVMEDSKIPLSKWLFAMYLMCSGKNGVSAYELHRQLKITYKSAWFMAHRIRYALQRPPVVGNLASTVESAETYVGGRIRRAYGMPRSNMTPVVTLDECPGEARSQVMNTVTGENVRGVLRAHVDPAPVAAVAAAPEA